ncbi:MAG TPA: prepilin-type N-terminal cleavage/methylation domain-containing protein [Pyrinomonadaceae bacterium]|nr:prepilin-type N-terminal cleavage/methylation domain-containing protein [Pyrinomonadaceae bacterium]
MIGKIKEVFKKLKDKIIATNQSQNQKGFSLFELMIAMFIIIILISVALPTYQRSVQHARELVLKENLFQLRRAIDQYATDKGKLPQSLDDLVQGKYLREIPMDPILEKPEWQSVMGEDPNSADGEQGLKDVKSMADGESSDGKAFSEL